MLDKLEKIVADAKAAAEAVKTFPGEIRVVSHYDADGITSAAIITRALQREGKSFHVTLLKQLGDERLKEISPYKKDRMFIFSDFGSGMLTAINNHLRCAPIIILDHHQPEVMELALPNMIEINPVKVGINDNIAASGVAYIFARAMDPQNRDMAHLAVIGAIGDSQMGAIGPKWGLMGLNAEIVKDAQEMKKIRVGRGMRLWGRYTRPIHKALEYSMNPYIPGVSGSESGSVQLLQEAGIDLKRPDGSWKTMADLTEKEQQRIADKIIMERIRHDQPNPDWIFGDIYELLEGKEDMRDANELATMLNATGKTESGYIGIMLCLGRTEAHEAVKDLMEKYKRTLSKASAWIREHPEAVMKTKHADYIMAGDNISEHAISSMVSILNNSMDNTKPMFGLVDAEEGTKVSARASDRLVRAGLNLKELVAAAVKETGGQGGGHSGAAGATIPKGAEKKFIELMEKALERIDLSVSEPGIPEVVEKCENNIKDLNQNVSNQESGTPAVPDKKDVLDVRRKEAGQETGRKEEVDKERWGNRSGEAGPAERTQATGVAGKEGSNGKKVEGQGLVRYLEPKGLRREVHFRNACD
jgi:RecJ-like exonuclease